MWRQCGLAFDRELGLPAAASERKLRPEPYPLHARQCPQLFLQALVEGELLLFGRILSPRQLQPETEHARRCKTGIDLLQAMEAAQQQAGSNQQYQC